MSAHVFPVRVYYEDTDAAGIVYYANYLKFAERARTEMLRDAGIHQRVLAEESGVAFAVRSCTADYLAPARLDDLLEVRTRITSLHGATIEAEQVVMRDGQDIARLTLTLACIGPGGKPRRVPAAVVDALSRCFSFATSQQPSEKQEFHG
jgi:acyl-CoA thioester hydrolase